MKLLRNYFTIADWKYFVFRAYDRYFLQLLLQLRVRSSLSSHVFTLLCRSQKERIEFRDIINIVYPSIRLRFPLKEQKGARRKKSRARRNYFLHFVTCKYPRETGVLISRCRMKIRQRAKEGTQRKRERKREKGRNCKRQKGKES